MRKIEDIQKEYAQLCAQLGEVSHRINQLPTVARDLSRRLKSLEKEAAQSAQEQANKIVSFKTEVSNDESNPVVG